MTTAIAATAEMHHQPLHCACMFGLHKHSASVSEGQWMPFFPHRRIQLHNFGPYAFPCQVSFCQTAPLLPSVSQQQHVKEYWWEGLTSTAMPPTSVSDVMGQRNKIGGITFGTALYNMYVSGHIEEGEDLPVQ